MFTFENRLYTQIDDVAVGSPIGPSYDSTCLCYDEKNWLHNLPIEFKPFFYERYVYGTFLLFKLYLCYLNDQNRNIKNWKEKTTFLS